MFGSVQQRILKLDTARKNALSRVVAAGPQRLLTNSGRSERILSDQGAVSWRSRAGMVGGDIDTNCNPVDYRECTVVSAKQRDLRRRLANAFRTA